MVSTVENISAIQVIPKKKEGRKSVSNTMSTISIPFNLQANDNILTPSTAEKDGAGLLEQFGAVGGKSARDRISNKALPSLAEGMRIAVQGRRVGERDHGHV